MKKPTSSHLYHILLAFVLILSCTKNVGLVTEVEFDLSEQHEEMGYVSVALPTTVTVTPEAELKGYEYFFSYSVSGGEGHYEDEEGNILPAGEKIPLTPLSATVHYMGSTVGEHLVRIKAEDNFGFTEEIELKYVLTEVPVVWTATSPVSEIELGKTAPITVTLGTGALVTATTYERNYKISTGSGSLTELSAEEVPSPDGYTPIVPGTHQLVFSPDALGAVTIEFHLRDSNGQELSARLEFEVVQDIVVIGIDLGDNETIEMEAGSTRESPVTFDPANATDRSLSWSSSDPSVASVDANGLITAVSLGSAVITATSVANVRATDTVNVTVIPAQSGTNDITAFSINSATGTISGADIAITLPSGTVVTALTPAITHNGASISPASGTAGDFTDPVTYTVTASNGDTQTYTVTVTVAVAGNQPPVANDDVFTVVENGALNRNVFTDNGNGADTDPDGDSISVDQVNGNLSNIGNSVTGSNGGTFTIQSNGNLVFDTNGDFNALNDGENAQTSITYRITDGTVSSTLATIIVAVTGASTANQLPTVNAGPDQTITLPTSMVTLIGSANDPDGSIATYLWENITTASLSATIVSPSAANTDVTGLVAGNYEFRLTVTDNSGGTASDIVKITVNSATNQAPTAIATSDVTSGDAPLTVSFNNATSFDPDGTIVLSNWNRDGANSTLGFPHPMTYTFNTAGTYIVTLTITDNDGATADDTITITVNDPADTTKPVITLLGANPQTIVEIGAVTAIYIELGATALDNVDGDITANIIIDASGVNTNATGTYFVTYNVMDAAGNVAIEVVRTVQIRITPSCFVAGTSISMADGEVKNIEDVRVGDSIVTFNIERHEIEIGTVEETVTPIHRNFVQSEFKNGIVNTNTLDHPYYVKDKGWCSYDPKLTEVNYDLEVGKLSVGDIVLYYNIQNNNVVEIELVKLVVSLKEQITYNLQKVSNNHNFFANGILVHNKYNLKK